MPRRMNGQSDRAWTPDRAAAKIAGMPDESKGVADIVQQMLNMKDRLEKPLTPAFFANDLIPAAERNVLASTMYERLAHNIKEFQATLAENEEVGAMLAAFGQTVTISVEDIRFHNPHVIIIDGLTQDGHRCTLLQHDTQVNILLVAVKAQHTPARRIGFNSDVDEPEDRTDE